MFQPEQTDIEIMKKKNTIILFSGVLLLTLLVHSGCNHFSDTLVFEQDQKQYVIDRESATVSIFTHEGTLSHSIGIPSAGVNLKENPLPPAIVHYLLLSKGTISGLVWNDLNGNRVFDAGEQGVQGVRVYIDYDGSATYSLGDPSRNTSVDGSYSIPRIQAGTWNVSIDLSSLPAGYGITTAHPYTLSLAKKQVATDANFGIRDQSGEIKGNIWDQTENSPMPGVIVYLDQNKDFEYTIGEPHATTDGSGNYLIANLPGGTYNFIVDDETINDKYYQPPDAGTTHTDAPITPGGSLTINLAYVHKATISGVVLDADGNPWGNIRLFIDLNGNGVLDAGEPVTVTDAFGNYFFDGLLPGTYTVIISMPNGYTMIVSPASITVNGGENYTGAHFLAQAQPVTITGYAWDDENGNGIRETGEKGLAGMTILLDDNNNGTPDSGELSTVTDDTGAYSFTGLDSGKFYIRGADSTILNAYIPTTSPNPVYKVLSPSQAYDGARFGYQKKLAPVHALLYPTRISRGIDGNLYVSDNINGSVFIYDSTLNITGELKNLSRPLGVITDSAGNIYVGNEGRKNIEVYDSVGNLLRSIDDGNIATPNDLAFDRDGNIYVLDSSVDTVKVYDQTGSLTGTTIGDSTRFDYAVSIALNYRDDGSGSEVGELYVADQPNCTIHVFALDGTYKKSFGSCGSLYTTNWDGKFAGLVAIDIDRYGNIHGLDNSLNVVQVFEPQNGTFVTSYNAYPVENELLLNLQTDISIHPVDDKVLMSNVATKSIETIATVPAP